MIRHRIGNEFLLIAQNDHAVFSGALAAHLGNQWFAPPSPFLPTVQGIALHDSGWPLHDDAPTLDEQGLPLHVLHTPIDIATTVFNASVDRAIAAHPWSGLLVSQHVLRLSSLPHRGNGEDGKPADAHVVFAINKFQHRQIEIQESLRARLGMRTDLPLTLGLARPGTDEDEDEFLVAAGWMRAMDTISLQLCCDRQMFDSIDQIFPRPGSPPVTLSINMPEPSVLAVDPWPFDVGEIQTQMPCRRVSAEPFASLDAFREAYAAAAIENIVLRAVPF
jgi:Protein of unknown function (DUF3891)